MIDYKKYDRLVSYGCSWTAGDEIRDHIILDLPYQKCRKLKLNLGFTNFGNLKTKAGDRYSTLLDNNKHINSNASWTSYLAKNLDLKFKNRAQGGSSMDQILYNIVKDTGNGLLSSKDLIIVGITTPARSFMWKDGESPSSYVLGTTTQISAKAKDWCLTNIWSDSQLIYNWLKTINTIAMMQENVYFLFSRPICNPVESENYKVSHENKFFYEQTMQKLRHKFLDLKLHLELGHDNDHCGFGHPQEKEHIKLANKLTNLIKGN